MSTKITVNEVISAVSNALYEKFPDYPIGTELIEEGLDEDYLFIRVLEPSHTRELRTRFRKVFPLVIHYFAKDRSNLKMYDMSDQLTEVLATPLLDGRQLLAEDMRFQIIDEVLLFFVTYSLVVYEEEEQEKVQSTELEVLVKYE